MRANSLNISMLMASALVFTACSSEDLAPAAGGENGETVHVTLTADRACLNTRTVISETDDFGLSNEWAEGDVLTVVSATGVVGTLSLDSSNGSVGVFSGNLPGISADQTYAVWYLGAEKDDLKPYASFKEGTTELVNALAEAGCSVSGDFADLNRGDLMMRDGLKFIVNGEKASAAANVTLEARMAMAHFTLSGTGVAEALAADDAELTLTYGNCSYDITDVAADVYVPMIPGTYPLSFSLTADSKTYAFAYDSDVTVEAGLYYTGTTGNGDGHGISIELEDVTEPETPVVTDDDLVGPAIKIGEKYYRFVKGNLYYDMNDASWHLYEKETHYGLLAGTSSPYGKQINGKAVNANTNHIIDLFAWGATGLGESSSNARAKAPDLIRQGWANEYTWAGSNWPCYNTDTMDVNGNANITDLWSSYTYTDPIYDFGWAYMQKGRPEGDTRRFVTAPLEAYAYICDQDRSFSQGCTVKGAGLSGEDVKGALIILGVTTAAQAKEKIEGVGGSVSSSFKKLNVSVNNAGFDFQITLPNYDSIEELGAMFFALAGSSNWATSQQLSKDCGNYWTSNGSKGSSADANGHSFFFRKSSAASEFHWVVGRNGVSKTRRTQNSVRLMVEVDAPTAQ